MITSPPLAGVIPRAAEPGLRSVFAQRGMFAYISQVRGETFSYVGGHYNLMRRHSALAYKTPEEIKRESGIKRKEESSERIASGIT